jgi:molybdopterin-guanine dinucleotide biosynthesis protein A
MAEVERRLHSADRSLRGLLSAVGAAWVGPDEVAEVADPREAFLNVNTSADRDRAEALLVSLRS